MKCPTCPDTTLVLSDRQGVEIDYCPACRGIAKLLDRQQPQHKSWLSEIFD
jgi:Zn-finger nucleic acid-binding protein